MARPEELKTPLYSLEAKLFVLCAGPGEVSNLGCERRHCSLHHLLIIVGVLLVRHSTLASSLREICCYATSHLPLWVTNEGREVNSRDITKNLERMDVEKRRLEATFR